MKKAAAKRISPELNSNFYHALTPAVLLAGVIHIVNCANADEFSVTSRVAHDSVWESISFVHDEQRGELAVTNRYIETATGLNYFNEASGQFEASDPAWEVVNGRLVVRKAQHRAMLGADSLDAEGLVQLWSPDGEWAALQTAGLALTDPVSGKSVWLAELQEVAPEFVDANTIVYPSALVGDGVVADIQVTSRLSGIECDVVVRRAITRELIEEYQMDPAVARVEAWHSIVGKSNLESALGQIERASGVHDENHSLRLGEMEFAQGKAFPTMNDGTAEVGASEVIVGKEVITIEGVEFLIESIPFVDAEEALGRLPGELQAGRIDGKRLEEGFAQLTPGQRAMPISLAGNVSKAGELKATAIRTGEARPSFDEALAIGGTIPLKGEPSFAMARSTMEPLKSDSLGYVIDYVTVNTSQSNYRWSGAETYLITGTVNLTGTNTFFEGGTVIKFATNSGAKIVVKAPIVWEGDAYRPVVLTGRDDASVGQVITPTATWNQTNRYAEVALEIAMTNNPAIIQNLRIRQAKTAIQLNGKAGHVISHAQFVNCGFGIQSAQNADFAVRNALFYNVATNFLQSGISTGRLEHVTANLASKFNHNVSSLAVTNSILATIGSMGTISSSNSVSSYASLSGVFKSVLAGAHYLADGSTNRNSATPNVEQSLSNDLKSRTTFAPVELTSNFTIHATLAPLVARDADGLLDRGYHYDSLDFVTAPRGVTNATVLLTNGVAIGGYGSHLFKMTGSGTVISEGKATALNRITTYNNVQEQPVRWVTNHTVFDGRTINLRFTDVSLMSGLTSTRQLTTGSYLTETTQIRDSLLRGIYWSMWNYEATTLSPEIGLTNNVFERCTLQWNQGHMGYPGFLAVQLQNNLFSRCSLLLQHYSHTYGNWDVYDNLFDSCSFSFTEFGPDAITTADFNGYIDCLPFMIYEPNSRISLVREFVSGPFGRFYYPVNGLTNSLASLRNAGSKNATNVGLFHYTTLADQVKETNSVVDIGFHYVATAPYQEIPKTLMTATASSAFSGWPATNAIDGLITDNGWHNGSYTEEPAWLKIDLGSSRNVGRIGYIAREANGNWWEVNGRYREFMVYVSDVSSSNPDDWGRPAIEGEFVWESIQDRRDLFFPSVNGRYVYLRRITADGEGSPPGYANANEVWLYAPGPDGPLDGDQDHLPDYIEDANGNGTHQTGETIFTAADTDSDGIIDGYEVDLGLNPLSDEPGQTGERLNFEYDPPGRLRTVTGRKSETITVDQENNLTEIAP